MKKILFILSISCINVVFADSVDDRTKLSGNVLIGEEKVKSNEEVSSGPREASKIYGTFCVACHSIGVAGAPKKGDKEQWTAKVAGRSIDEILASAKKGIKAMPAKGNCLDCSDAELKSTIKYMSGLF